MRPNYKYKKAIFLCLILLTAESLVGQYVSGSLSNLTANYIHKLEFIREPPESDKVETPHVSNMRIIDGPNGTEVFVEFVEAIGIQAFASGEVFDYSVYIRHVLFWTILKNFFDIARDFHEQLFETTICVLCVLFIAELPKLLVVHPRFIATNM